MAENEMGGVRETAQQEGTAVAQHAKDAAGEVRATAQDQFGQVAHEAKAQAADVLRDARSRVAEEAEQQARKASTQLGRIADELSSMAENASPDSMSAGAIRQVADTSRQAARYLDERGARGLLDSAQDFARRRPGAFLLGAAVAGFLVGRVAKSATGTPRSGQTTPSPTRQDAVPEFGATPELDPATRPFEEQSAIGTDRDPSPQDPYAPGPVYAGGARHVQP
ncbi:MAG TPA: hypothetical protein VF821_22475 [Lentzea sp.]